MSQRAETDTTVGDRMLEERRRVAGREMRRTAGKPCRPWVVARCRGCGKVHHREPDDGKRPNELFGVIQQWIDLGFDVQNVREADDGEVRCRCQRDSRGVMRPEGSSFLENESTVDLPVGGRLPGGFPRVEHEEGSGESSAERAAMRGQARTWRVAVGAFEFDVVGAADLDPGETFYVFDDLVAALGTPFHAEVHEVSWKTHRNSGTSVTTKGGNTFGPNVLVVRESALGSVEAVAPLIDVGDPDLDLPGEDGGNTKDASDASEESQAEFLDRQTESAMAGESAGMSASRIEEERWKRQVEKDLTQMAEAFRKCCGHIFQNAVQKGWWDEERNDGELLALMHGEISEALEGIRVGNPADDHIPQYTSAEAELADVVIRIMDMAFARDWDVAGAIVAKAIYNMSRPRMHGGKKF